MKYLLALLAALAILLAACGGGGDDNETPAPAASAESTSAASPEPTETVASPEPGETGAAPTAEATVENRDEVEALLKAASLQSEDLPEGFALDQETFTTNEEASVESGGINQPTLEDFNNWGRVLGYDATYSDPEALSSLSEGGTLSLTATTTLYEDSGGADDALNYVRDQAEDPKFLESFEETIASSTMEVTDANITPISLAKLGDDRQAYELSIKAHSTDLDQDFEFIAQLMGIRRDRLIGAVTLITINVSPPEGQLEDLARSLDGHMNDALD
jgi:hypothetical protein